MKVKNILKEILYEEKEKSLFFFYDIDIFLQGFPEEEEEESKNQLKNQK
jgi:hypothetical protein